MINPLDSQIAVTHELEICRVGGVVLSYLPCDQATSSHLATTRASRTS
jgi:hypothetical protein